MKKCTILAAMAAVAVSANAQFNTDNLSVESLLGNGVKIEKAWTLFLSDADAETLAKSGATVDYIGPNDGTRNLYVWPNGDSFVGGSDVLNVTLNGNALSFEVGNLGWSGAGYNIGDTDPGVDLTAMNENTRLHVAYMSPAKVTPGFYVSPFGEYGLSIGNMIDNDPVVGKTSNDDWQAIDLSFGDIKKLFGKFDLAAIQKADWKGNIFNFGGDGVQGNTLALDQIFFYNVVGEGGVAGVATEENAPVKYYNLNGVEVSADNLSNGIYVAKQGNKVTKFIK